MSTFNEPSIKAKYTWLDYCAQGRKANCAVVMLMNIYVHFGVDVNFTNRDTFKWGYHPGSGAYIENMLRGGGVIYKEIDLEHQSHKKIIRLIKKGVDSGKIYAIGRSPSCESSHGHAFLIAKNFEEVEYQKTAKSENFYVKNLFASLDMFLAINRGRERFFPYQSPALFCHPPNAGQFHSQKSSWLEAISEELLCEDLGISFRPFENEKKEGSLYEISGIKEEYAKKEPKKIYEFNLFLRDVLHSEEKRGALKWFLKSGSRRELEKRLGNALIKFPKLFRKMNDYLEFEKNLLPNFSDAPFSPKIPIIIEGRGLPIVKEIHEVPMIIEGRGLPMVIDNASF